MRHPCAVCWLLLQGILSIWRTVRIGVCLPFLISAVAWPLSWPLRCIADELRGPLVSGLRCHILLLAEAGVPCHGLQLQA